MTAVHRRADDADAASVMTFLRRWKLIVPVAMGIGSAIGWFGGQVVSPAQAIAQVGARADSSVRALQLTDREHAARIDELAQSTRLSTYLICTLTRRTDPAAVPPECSSVILQWRNR